MNDDEDEHGIIFDMLHVALSVLILIFVCIGIAAIVFGLINLL
jgi:hypothetical protein